MSARNKAFEHQAPYFITVTLVETLGLLKLQGNSTQVSMYIKLNACPEQ
jgi:hypothetical protein